MVIAASKNEELFRWVAARLNNDQLQMAEKILPPKLVLKMVNISETKIIDNVVYKKLII